MWPLGLEDGVDRATCRHRAASTGSARRCSFRETGNAHRRSSLARPRAERIGALLAEIVAQDKPHIGAPWTAIVRFDIDVAKVVHRHYLGTANLSSGTNTM
jgi:hypothetical protein